MRAKCPLEAARAPLIGVRTFSPVRPPAAQLKNALAKLKKDQEKEKQEREDILRALRNGEDLDKVKRMRDLGMSSVGARRWRVRQVKGTGAPPVGITGAGIPPQPSQGAL